MSLDEFTQLVAVLYLFLGGALTAVFAFSQVRNKNNADAISSLTKSVLDLNGEIARLKEEYDKKLAEKDSEIDRLKSRVAELELERGTQFRRGRQMGS